MNDGLGTMLHHLSGGSPKSASDYYGREIKSAELKDNEIKIVFSDGVKIKIWDDAQSCCESRYMQTDDKLSELVGQKLVAVNVKDTEAKDDGEVREICFLEIQGNKSSVTVSTHNDHNGYYGGFGLSVDEIP